MRILTLVEDTAISKEFNSEHGLSLYIEANQKKILFDVGASGLFLENARKLGVDIAAVDYLIISHGHYDHGGGLQTFLQENKKAKVYLRQEAFATYLSKRSEEEMKYIGLNEHQKDSSRFIFTLDNQLISDGISVFSNIKIRESLPIANQNLYMEKNGVIVKDSFLHEQNLVIEEGNKTIIITGCAHNGIVNIMEHFYKWKNDMPDYVIGGFHLSGRTRTEEPDTIHKIGAYLLKTEATFYTCHCTGETPYIQLKEILGSRIHYLSAGSHCVL